MTRARLTRYVSGLLLLALAAGCTGTIGDGGGGSEGGGSTSAGGSGSRTASRPNEASPTSTFGTPAAGCSDATGLVIAGGYRRLSNAELRNTYRAVLGETVWKAVATTYANLAPEPPEIGKRDPIHSATEVYGLIELAAQAAEAIVDQSANRIALIGACATSATPDRACVEAFVKRFAALAMRRAPTTAELQAWFAQYDATEADIRLKALVGRLLAAPSTLFVEENLGDVVGGRSRLTAGEVAARLSYGLTQGPPDAALLSAASAGRLTSREDVQREAARLLDSDAGRATMRAAFASWLQLANLPQPHVRNLQPLELAATGIRDDLQNEVLDFIEHAVQRGGGIQALLTDNVVFPSTAALAKIYGVAVAKGPVEPPRPRPGLLTRAALFAEASVGTSPILRGAHLQQRVLCLELGVPDNLVVDARRQEIAAELDPIRVSNRKLVERLTSPPQCMGCHTPINAAGFIFEGFDGAGASRTDQVVLDADGRIVARHPIDTRVRYGLPGQQPAELDGPEPFTAYLARHPSFVADCSARGIVDFVYQRQMTAPTRAGASCGADAVANVLRKGGSLRDAFIASVAHDGIFYRTAQDP